METIRQRIREYLTDGPRTLRQVSQEIRVSEDEALESLEHIAKDKGGGTKLHVTPAECHSCGYVFVKRERLKPPSRCPACKSERISHPLYALIPIPVKKHSTSSKTGPE